VHSVSIKMHERAAYGERLATASVSRNERVLRLARRWRSHKPQCSHVLFEWARERAGRSGVAGTYAETDKDRSQIELAECVGSVYAHTLKNGIRDRGLDG
jgi:hypothetical protein